MVALNMDSMASHVIEACCGSEAYEKAPYPWNPLLQRICLNMSEASTQG